MKARIGNDDCICGSRIQHPRAKSKIAHESDRRVNNKCLVRRRRKQSSFRDKMANVGHFQFNSLTSERGTVFALTAKVSSHL
jgi:hypothetical protein